MPNFFDPDNLTEEQRSRWDWAIDEYVRIRDLTFARIVQDRQLSETDQAQLRMLMEHQWDGAGNPKSALFARLLQGRSALDKPPPTRHSFPWYAVLEEPGPFDVEIDIIAGEGLISINECAWEIADANDAARAINDALTAFKASEEDAVASSRLQSEVADALARKPRWRVFYEQWPEFDLWLGRRRGQARRGEVERNTLSDVDFSGGNPRVLRVLEAGAGEAEDLVEFECDGWKLQRA